MSRTANTFVTRQQLANIWWDSLAAAPHSNAGEKLPLKKLFQRRFTRACMPLERSWYLYPPYRANGAIFKSSGGHVAPTYPVHDFPDDMTWLRRQPKKQEIEKNTREKQTNKKPGSYLVTCWCQPSLGWSGTPSARQNGPEPRRHRSPNFSGSPPTTEASNFEVRVTPNSILHLSGCNNLRSLSILHSHHFWTTSC